MIFNTIAELIAEHIPLRGAKVGILGMTFKENCPDTRNSKVADIIGELSEYGITPLVADPVADAAEAKRLYGVSLCNMDQIREMDAVVVAVAHDAFKALPEKEIDAFFQGSRKVLFDLKGILGAYAGKEDYHYWRL